MSGKCTKCGYYKGSMSYCENCEVKPEKEVKVYTLKRTPIKKVSQKMKVRQNAKLKTYAEIAEERPPCCVSCGTTSGRIDRSHTISVKHRKDLEAVAENIQYRCRKCHALYDSGDINKMIQLADWNESLEYIRKTDKEYYQIIMNKLGKLTRDLNEVKQTV